MLTKTMEDGTPLAILGLTLKALPELTDVGHGINVAEPVAIARRQVEALRTQGIYRILVLSHLGEDADEDLARAVPDVSAIFGGHTHRLYGQADTFAAGKSRPCGARIGDVPLFHCGENGQYFGAYTLRLRPDGLAVEAWGETRVPVDCTYLPPALSARLSQGDDTVPVLPAQDACAVLAQRFPLSDQRLSVPLVIDAPLPHIRAPTNERCSVLAPLFAEAVLRQLHEAQVAADISLLNAGVIRTGIASGEYPQPHELLMQVVPFDLEIIVLRIPGAQLDRVLTRARQNARAPDKSGCFPYLSFARPDFGPIETQVEYNVAMTSYVSSGKDGYTEFAALTLRRVNSGFRLRQICETFLYGLAKAYPLGREENL